MSSCNSTADLYLRPLPFLDAKWLRADLIASLRNVEDAAVLWNNLIQDCELVSSPAAHVLNAAGHLSYLGDDGKHYCGVQKLQCSCCPLDYCGPLSACNCPACRTLDSDSAIKKMTTAVQNAAANRISSEVIFESWLWGQCPNTAVKLNCQNTLLAELHDISLQAAGNCLSSIHLRQQLLIYERYFVALSRWKQKQELQCPNNGMPSSIASTAAEKCKFNEDQRSGVNSGMCPMRGREMNYLATSKLRHFSTVDVPSPIKENERATLGLARVGTRAALNFSFAFLRRAWRSGEDTEMCSELLSEALESLQDLPEASLFDATQVSTLWIEVLERSIKFLRQVALGDPLGGRCTAPREDRHTALCLLLELGAQKGTLAATLEAIVLLLTLWEKEKETDDNRDAPQNTGAPLVPILRRYEYIGNYGINNTSEASLASATESFLRFLTLPDEDTTNVDLKQAAVVIISHLDRLAKPHLPTSTTTATLPSRTMQSTKPPLHAQASQESISAATTPQLHEQRIYALGWLSLCHDQYGFTAEPAVGLSMAGSSFSGAHYPAPVLNFYFQVKQVAFSEEYVLFLTHEGKMYTWRTAKPETEPMLIEEMTDVQVTAVAAHCEGRHFMAVDSMDNAYSWGCGEGGRLGHGDSLLREHPTKIQSLEPGVKSVYCGCTYSAAITMDGNLYTWGRGTYGRLGHGNSDDKLLPTHVHALREYSIIDVALGSGDSHTLCLTVEGLVFAWGDGDYGKLGNGSCNGSQVPLLIETLPLIKRVYAGSQFSMALSCDGKLYSWGKAYDGRLGHGLLDKNIQCLNTPKQISALQSKVIVDVSVGVWHCLAMSNKGEVFGWGRNDFQQVCPASISKEPILRDPILATHPSVQAFGIACGAAQSIIWSQSSVQSVPMKLPFVIDLSEHTFRLLDQLLGIVCGQDSNYRQTPNQESECIAVACLNLLRLQLHALIVNAVSPKSVGLSEGSRLLVSLKTRIFGLAGGSNVLKTMQEAAQWTLQVGWSVLLPTASERAQTLTSLLPSESGISSSGHRFMTDLLVGSLMAEGGLETALKQAIRLEANDCADNGHNLPLLHLIRQLLRNNSALTQARLTQLLLNAGISKPEEDSFSSLSATQSTMAEHTSPSLDLLHRFQRLLFSHIHQSKNEDINGAEALLSKYVQSAVSLCILSLQKAHEIALQGKETVADIIKTDISDTLLFELLIGLIILKRDRASILPAFEWTKVFLPLLHALDNLNRIICDSEVQDSDDMGWPGIICRGNQKGANMQPMDDVNLIRKNDFENHILDGGKWIILNGYVCDVSDYQNDNAAINELLSSGIGKDLTVEMSTPIYRNCLEHILSNYKVGRYAVNLTEEKPYVQQSKVLTHFNSERALAYLLGLVVNLLQTGPVQQPAELQCKTIVRSSILRGGLQLLQPSNPFDEEKGEARSSASTAGSTPTEPPIHSLAVCGGVGVGTAGGGSGVAVAHPVINSVQQRIEIFIAGLSEARLTDPLVVTWMTLSEKYCKDNNLIWHQEFPPEHPVQELERLLTAVLIRHQSLGGLVLNVLERELSGVAAAKTPRQIADMIRLIYQTKWSVVRIRQQLNRSYKEVCAPMLERLRFLLYEVRPAVSLEQEALRKLPILHRLPRFKHVVRRIIAEMRMAKKQLACGKPEDILNVTIQSQNVAQKLHQSHESLLQGDCAGSESTDKDSAIGTNDNDSSSLASATVLIPPLRGNASNENLLDAGDNNAILSDRKASNEEIKLQANELDFDEDKKPADDEPRVNNDLLRKLREKWYFSGELNMPIMHEIVEFVMQEVCDVETVRRAMYCQVQRYQIRRQGLEMLHAMLQVHGLFDAVQYNMLNGYLGLHLKSNNSKQATLNVLYDLNMITAFQKADLLLAQSRVLEWAVLELQRLVNQELIQLKGKYNAGSGKDTSNLGTYVFLKKLPRARFLLSIFGILAKDMSANELSLIVNSGTLGTVLGLLSQTGGEMPAVKNTYDLSVVYEDTILKQKSNKANLTGPELAKLMKIGTRIVRGADWKWGDQDGNPPGEGRIISEVGEDGWVRVEWYTGATNSYRMGKEGQYDLRLAESALNIISPDTETEKDELCCDTQLNGESHPTKLLRYACTKTLQIISVGIGLHSAQMDKNAVRCISSMFRSILDPKSTLGNIYGLDNWTTLGFLKAIAGESKSLAKYLSSTTWIEFYINLLEQPITREQDLFRNIHCLRLLQSILIHWTDEAHMQRMAMLVRQFFSTLGKITLYCPHDISLQQNVGDCKTRVLLTASHSGTIAEEIITLLRRLHTLPYWNAAINSFLAQKLCVAAELFGEDGLDLQHLENEYIYVMGVLCTIGGCDIRVRVGLQVCYEGNTATICGFTNKGKCLLSTDSQALSGEFRKISLSTAFECADYSVFSLSRLPLNEMLLNSWAVLLFGPGERKECVPNGVDISLLRGQQIQLSVLNANCVLYRHQAALRKILKQRSPGLCAYSSDESLSEEAAPANASSDGKSNAEGDACGETDAINVAANSDELSAQPTISDAELLIQSILIRATQPSPIKAIYNYADLSTAALNCAQVLAAKVHNELNEAASTSAARFVAPTPPMQPTMIHGVPVYNVGLLDEASGSSQPQVLKNNTEATPLIAQIMEMGFSKKSVELAVKQLTIHPEVIPTPEQIVQWILEHPDVCANTIDATDYLEPPLVGGGGAVGGSSSDTSLQSKLQTLHDPEADSDNESLDSSSDTVEGSSIHEQLVKFETRKDFPSADQYAQYVRGLVCPGMLVRCCRDFEEIKKGDIGTVLKVDTEGLHDLNVQVDWQLHGNTYWVCFVHIELLEMPREKTTCERSAQVVVGTQVRLRAISRYKWGYVLRGSVGTVTAVRGKDVTVDFPQHAGWKGTLNDIEVVGGQVGGPSGGLLGLISGAVPTPSDLIEDWSRCIRSLTVSSNESTAKHLLDRSPYCWQSSSSSQTKHWIRLEMHEHVLVHSLSIVVSPGDHSHQPSLVVVRVGDSIGNLKDYSWISIKNTDTTATLMSDVRQYYPWVEIVIKQCRNNGIQCKVHGLNIVGRRKQTDLDLLLMNASFLACEYEQMSDSNPCLSSAYSNADPKSSLICESPCTVMVWGLNDKEQLGGLKGSKVKVPTFSQTISRLRPIHIAGGSKSLFIVSQDGKVYACGEGTNGRLGLGISVNVSVPRQVPVLHQYVVKKVAVHSGGKHAMALTLDGKVFSWGEGEDGKLGHGNRLTMEKPKLIEALRAKKIRDIACGSSHSAAITSAGELYTWGLGEYGRLGHGDNATQLKPKLVAALSGKRVIQVACGSRDAQTLALTEEGVVYSWGDGDFGKLGRGGSEGSSIPHEIERLTGIGVIQIECGAQFSLALTRTGEVWTWGKGDYYRLGHGSDQHVRKPQPIQALRGRKVIHLAVGALHCLAVTDTGQVYAWGDNDHGQQGSGNTVVNKKPALVIGLDSVFVNRVACGSSHAVAWGLPQSPSEDEKKGPVPFATSKDPLGGSSLGIYDTESQLSTPTTTPNTSKPTSKVSLSETLLSLETDGARQTALNYVLNAMSILQARQLIVAALTSHSKVNLHEKTTSEFDVQEGNATLGKDTTTGASRSTPHSTLGGHNSHNNNGNNEVIAQGGGEAPADATDPAVHEPSPEAEIVPAPAGPLSAFQSLTGSLSLSASISSNAPHKHSKMSASAMSALAATMTNQEEIIEETSLTGLDDFTSLLGESEAKSLVELLKLSVAGRTGPLSTSQTISDTLIALGSNSPTIGVMLLETCITELEDLCTSRYSLGKVPKPVMRESSHPYVDNITIVGQVKIPGAESLRIEFDSQCSTEKRNDPLVIMDTSGRVVAVRSGREYAQWAPEVRILGDEMRWKFTSDSSVNGWGWRFWVHGIMPATALHERGSDRAVLSQPSMPLVMALLNERLGPHNTSVLLRLAAALAACAQLNSLTTTQRIWSLKQLHTVLLSKHTPQPMDPALNSILMPLIPELLRQYEYEEPQVRGGIHLMHSDYFKTLAALACDMQLDAVLPPADVHKWSWFKRYCIAVRVAQSLIKRTELPRPFCMEVRKKFAEMMPAPQQSHSPVGGSGGSMMNSTTSLSSAGSTNSNPTPPPPPSSSTIVNTLTPSTSNLIQYIDSMMSLSLHEPSNVGTGGCSSLPPLASSTGNDMLQFLHEDHTVFKGAHDSQLLQWLNRRPDDWALSWGGASTIYGWGHNHRGQLGGLEGSRIKTPTPCEALSLLRPVQLAGGEQTLFAVTPDGKCFATGYGSGGRLGVGGTDSWAIPTLIGSLQHVFVKKVAVNSGGKHCLALTTEGEVYSWGEGEDGKLGHGNRMSYDRPKLIEDLTGIGIVDIACGSAHSAAITSSGHVLTWGKGRYGRLGHGDSEDQLRPKLVEALLGYRAIDVACGSGDAQTLCITDDDNVWSWGDGDYGKLGRGGSDGCKLPYKIESLAGLGVVKVECGSQFSVALTKSGAVYTWGKGDFHRLGHGTVDHVRRPKKVAALQGKKIVSIATGSLHCVACTDAGEVYTWGDNDEGQLGDGTVSAIQRPRLVAALQNKHIVKVTCGSAHTIAMSTSQLTDRMRPPPNPPLEYDLVREMPPEALHARLVLLHHFSELLCPCLAMLPIIGELSLGALKDVLVYTIKEAAFRKVIQTTMVRDKQHGPVIELNRIQVKRSRNKSGNGLAGIDGMKSVFGQMVQKLPLLTQEALSLPHRVWKVKFVGESVDDCGGGYSESIAEMCDELQNGSVPLLITTPNGRGEAGANRDCFLLDPTLSSVLQMNMFRFLGVLMGIAVRTGSPLSLNLAETVWRQLAGEQLRPSDLTEVDRDYVAGLLCIRNMDEDPKVFSTLELPFSTSSAKGHEVPLSTRYMRISPQNRHEYVRLALNFRLHEFDEQVKAVRDGMSKVIPVPLLSLFSAPELQAMVCGSPDIPLGLLKSVATYKGFDPNSALVTWFWEVMEEFSNQERSLFLRFVWGRTRLPRTIADFRGRDFVLQVLDKSPPDNFLPESYTCFFLLKMPRYSCKAVLLEKLKYAIHFCKSIDTDEYARVAMGDPTEATGSEDDSDLESAASNEA
ncbi:probable E3 ubiquitin-protein ligase HERC2 [Anastrepha obliqua]|uniref:probable E3 ubiquitin-protein ligase HERC2 n=1 Tax=Anastrepha obliqua TaxID=95512 RepID=UPI002409029B|nr:probable E3 ubiquitin-protein ligase HERC2 [Anastrepha obliqua]XP_054728196.1 probable E3 ubiquitin-protein ligase HERC2 [Anastrepha obliqua]